MAEEGGGGGGGEKSQAPTEKKLQQAREDGNIAQSKELLLLVSLGSFLLVFALTIPVSARQFMHDMEKIFGNFGVISNDSGSIFNETMFAFWSAVGFMGPIMGTGACTILIIGLLQTGFLFRPKALQPDPTKMSPLKGIKRVFGVNNLIELIKTMAKISVFGLILYSVAKETVNVAPQSERWTPYQLIDNMKSWFIYAGFLILSVQVAITVLDEVWTRFHRFSKLKMSLQDIKDETKQTEGDPQIKARQRQIRMSRSRRQIKKAIKEATVIVVNPTHYSVVIKYDALLGEPPKLMIKGVDEMALRIRLLAREANVPIVANPPLARSLYKLPEETEIPEGFWKPVATVIAYVMNMKENK